VGWPASLRPPVADEQRCVEPQRALKCSLASRCHHLLKTFWGWRDKQLPDGTVIWDLPDGHTYVTTPGSALLFPSLCAPTGDLSAVVPTPDIRCGNREAMMPTRTRTRTQNRANRINAERRHNRQTALAAHAARAEVDTSDPPSDPNEPPPF
jgi:hypothetical protein